MNHKEGNNNCFLVYGFNVYIATISIIVTRGFYEFLHLYSTYGDVWALMGLICDCMGFVGKQSVHLAMVDSRGVHIYMLPSNLQQLHDLNWGA